MGARPWTEAELESVAKLHGSYPFDYMKIAEEVNRTPRAVKNILHGKFGFKKADHPPALVNANLQRKLQSDETSKALGMFPGFFNDFKRGAEGKKLGNRKSASFIPKEFTITPEYMLLLFYGIQKERCYLSGVPITIPLTSREYQLAVHTASIDRIDSSKGYVPGNVAWVHKEVNMMKGSLPNENFIHWARLIAAANP